MRAASDATLRPEGGRDRRNRVFWEELCGSSLARALGIREHSPASLARYDRAYLAVYPYLERYVDAENLRSRRVLEIGLGYGPLGQILARESRTYVGIDVAVGPVDLMRRRLAWTLAERSAAALQASALDLPFPRASFDAVYAIGCLHHTGDLPRAVGEVRRVLAPQGRAVVMLYHRRSLRRILQEFGTLRRHVSSGGSRAPLDTRAYDANAAGDPAPITEFVSRGEARELFRDFSAVRVESRNFDSLSWFGGRLVVPRERLLDSLGRVVGLDLYVVATV